MRIFSALALVCQTLFLLSVPQVASAQAGRVVVANRGGASISVVDVATSAVTTHPMPPAINTAEPMYVVYSPANNVVLVGDRMNDRIVAFDANNYSVVNPSIPAGRGVFHMWGHAGADQLWVNNDIDRSISVIGMSSLAPVTTIPTPLDLGEAARPHDVILDPNGSAAYVTIIGADGPSDFVVKYSTTTFAELDRQAVGKDPHVTLTPHDNLLYVASQGSSRVDLLDRGTLDPLSSPAPPIPIPVTNAHGIAITNDGQTFYNTSFPGNGADGVKVIDTATHAIIDAVDAPAVGSGPHNIALSLDNTRMFITHTGATSSTLSVFDITGDNRLHPAGLPSLTVGLNPFGVAAVPVPEPSSWALAALAALGCSLALRRRRSR
jgi:DNA-binding beta-propeller fold protein YncE